MLDTNFAYVYLIRESGTNYYKIGTTKKLKARSRNLQTGSANKLEIVRTWRIDAPTDKARSRLARSLEAWLHHQLRDYHYRGEWFVFDSLLVLDFFDIQLRGDRAIEFGII